MREKTSASYLSQLFSLENKTAVVIGAGGFLCSEMAKALGQAGASVAMLDRDASALEKKATVVRKTVNRLMTFPIDVTQKSSHEKVLAEIRKQFGTVDILINGAGINAPTPFFEIKQAEWDGIIASHVTGTMLACQVFGEEMVKQKEGSIINMSSQSAGPPLSKAFAYSVAKAGIKNLTQNLAREWAPFHVRVNALRPGFFPTEWSKENFITPEREKAILSHTPMGRYGRPDELIGAVLWLASDASSFVTGAEIAIDGGFSCMTI
ncbi:MAG: gluconate 5-dehydrogenase [Candidatus Omnitrophica bacterium CG11_big_fil_rev_8_21_14_0_20_45_26]|uniref:Gluconate 5-dehydrogenase n=1 Tax=Candidatus Abzuiibacterium crystallinum TaxID=1974748 RepID=A0A2H0LLJ6_9BACT|nr:MAG: gluconate 5-dehydrogenase [Candidatus Omnitrophica bacterium CG11_big_fil_rev_8_21_14_0_20_45_26]PIW64535.1 MAG: gluconate 5-dehydrogenase [Candidatus Omnitrophica bacterium CG12_big_fil_rev_8_21_14_0_65_45_16]